MPSLKRDPELAERDHFDLIIIGGGIYGAFLALQATRRGLHPLLLERDDFGQGTSFNSLRIVHGGLRYLQSADLVRYRQSVRERKWLLARFGDFVAPMPCLMPLYGQGLRRNSIMRLALLANDLLALSRNEGLPDSHHLPSGKVLRPEFVLEMSPILRSDDLSGGALWYDAALEDSQRLMIEVLRWSASLGGVALNYMEVTKLLIQRNRVTGVAAQGTHTEREHSFAAPIVINAAGPWAEKLARSFGVKDCSFFTPSLAWNLWINRPAPAPCALALTASRPDGPTYFIRPWKGRMLLGTGHAPWHGNIDHPYPSPQQIKQMLDDVNSAAPGLQLGAHEIRHTFAGLLPARQAGSANLSIRPVFVDHASGNGPAGLFSLCGVKFTTAHHVANNVLNRVFGSRPVAGTTDQIRPPAATGWSATGLAFNDKSERARYLSTLKRIISDESVYHLTDLVFRRTDLWENPDAMNCLFHELLALFDWDKRRQDAEIQRLLRHGVAPAVAQPYDSGGA